MNWIIENKEWLFSGVLVAIVGWLVSSKVTNRQSQKSGTNSTNIQSGKNVKITIKGKK